MSQRIPNTYSFSHALTSGIVCVLCGAGVLWLAGVVNTQKKQMATQVEEVKTEQSQMSQGLNQALEGVSKVQEKLQELQTKVQSSQQRFEILSRAVDERESVQATAEARAIELQAADNEIAKNLATLKSEINKWDGRVNSLLTDETGRRLAASPTHFKEFVPIYSRPRVTAEKIATWERTLTALIAPVNRAVQEKNVTYVLTRDHVADFEHLRTQVSSALDEQLRDSLVLDRLTGAVRDVAPGETTLSDAINAHKAETAVERSQLIEKALEADRQRRSRDLADALNALEEADNRLKIQEAKSKTGKVQGTTRKLERAQQINDELEGEMAAKAQLERDYEASLSEIRTLLHPFINRGITQPAKDGFQHVSHPVPVSFGRLQGLGALDATDEGLEKLYYYGGAYHSFRQTGGFPPYQELQRKRDPRVDAKVKRAQELLNKYGRLLIEKGMLAP